jgi:y4mF family transcriptional regulator
MRIKTPVDLSEAIRGARRRRRMTQRDLALIAGTGERVIVELEAGKPTIRLGHVLAVMAALGLEMTIEDSEYDAKAPVA